MNQNNTTTNSAANDSNFWAIVRMYFMVYGRMPIPTAQKLVTRAVLMGDTDSALWLAKRAGIFCAIDQDGNVEF